MIRVWRENFEGRSMIMTRFLSLWASKFFLDWSTRFSQQQQHYYHRRVHWNLLRLVACFKPFFSNEDIYLYFCEWTTFFPAQVWLGLGSWAKRKSFDLQSRWLHYTTIVHILPGSNRIQAKWWARNRIETKQQKNPRNNDVTLLSCRAKSKQTKPVPFLPVGTGWVEMEAARMFWFWKFVRNFQLDSDSCFMIMRSSFIIIFQETEYSNFGTWTWWASSWMCFECSLSSHA